jgi:hypothetical protein
VTITLSSTSNGPNTLSTTFANNVGADVTTVFSGDLSLSSAPSAAVPRPFDIVIPLQTPFFFNASAGKNLLVDVTLPGPPCNNTTFFDATQFADSVSRVFSISSSADPTGLADSTGLVTQFTMSPVARLTNLSTRALVGIGPDQVIAGFIIAGDTAKRVLIRGLGPTLGQPPFDVPGALNDPVLQVFPQGQIVPIAQNDNWMVLDPLCAPPAQACGGPAAIAATGLAPPLDTEAAVLLTLSPGAYTAILSGAGATTGVGLADVFEVP